MENKINEASTDLVQIVKNWNEKYKNGCIYDDSSYATISFLYDKAGLVNPDLKYGGGALLYLNWINMSSLFNAIFTADTEQDVMEVLSKECPEDVKNKILKLFNEVQVIKSNI